MCAIAGWWKPQFPAGFKQDVLFRHLARKCQMNGDKSFGVFSSKGHLGASGDGPLLEKFAGPASMWITQNEQAGKKKVQGRDVKVPSKLAEIAKSGILLMHTRWPTHGTVNTINCHPFKIGDWIACHNGVISNSKELMGKARFIAKGETDSEEALAYVVSENWSKESMDKIHGGFAFAGIRKDLTDGILVCDGYQRLNFAKVGTGYVWCTSADWLESSLVAAGFGDTRTLGIRALRNEILHLGTGQIERLTVANTELDDDVQRALEGTRTGGRGESRKAGEDRFQRKGGYTSKPLDLSIGRRMKDEAPDSVVNEGLEQHRLSAEEQAFLDEEIQADQAAGEDDGQLHLPS